MTSELVHLLIVLGVALGIVGLWSLWITKTKPDKELPASMRDRTEDI